MTTHRETGEIDCSGCSSCATRDGLAEDSGNDPLLSGWRLGMASAGLFLAPILLAIAGAICCGDGEGVQLLGAMAGLGVGMTGSVIVGRLLRRTFNPKPEATANPPTTFCGSSMPPPAIACGFGLNEDS